MFYHVFSSTFQMPYGESRKHSVNLANIVRFMMSSDPQIIKFFYNNNTVNPGEFTIMFKDIDERNQQFLNAVTAIETFNNRATGG